MLISSPSTTALLNTCNPESYSHTHHTFHCYTNQKSAIDQTLQQLTATSLRHVYPVECLPLLLNVGQHCMLLNIKHCDPQLLYTSGAKGYSKCFLAPSPQQIPTRIPPTPPHCTYMYVRTYIKQRLLSVLPGGHNEEWLVHIGKEVFPLGGVTQVINKILGGAGRKDAHCKASSLSPVHPSHITGKF